MTNKLLALSLCISLVISCNRSDPPVEPPAEPPPQELPQEPTPTDPELPSEPPTETPTPTPIPTPTPTPTPVPTPTSGYIPRGVGGGGAMSGVAISPYANLWFVGTDMGTLFRSTDLGKSWTAVNHLQAVFNSELTRAVSPGFSADGKTVFHASAGVNPQRSSDSGLTFHKINMALASGEYIKYWHSDSTDENRIFAATNKGLLVSKDKGTSWFRASGISGESVGTYIDVTANNKIVFHALPSGIWESANGGESFIKSYTPSNVTIRGFTGGRDSTGMTLAFIDNDGASACSWVYSYLAEWGQTSIDTTLKTCGHVWIGSSKSAFTKNSQAAGDHIKMAENDASTIYVTGGKKWIRQYGTKVHVTHNKGSSWTLKLHQMNWDVVPYAAWPSDKLEYSAVAMDVGWWDDGYESFEINRRNSKVVAGTGYFFLHASHNSGNNWVAPFTEYADTGAPAPKKVWKTRGVEVISIYRTKYHPNNPNLLYGASADIGGVISEDGGKSFRVSKAQYNSNYDYSFDPANDNVVYAASGNSHDFPNDWHANAIKNNGGIYYSANRGMTWRRLTPDNNDYNRQFLSVGYDAKNKIIYGGSHEVGITRSTDGGKTWNWFNSGMPAGNKIIPQIEVDPRNGNVYALLTGNAPEFTNQAGTGIYFLDVAKGATSWKLLRGTVHYPPEADKGYKVWYYPTAFAIDFEAGSSTDNIWLVDYENNRNWLMTGVWKTTDGGQNWHRVKQVTHPTDVKIDPKDSERIYVSGYFTLNGTWGNGGQLHSRDGGASWKKNEIPPLQQNARSVTIDPLDSRKLIYSYFGGGMLSGPNPSYQ